MLKGRLRLQKVCTRAGGSKAKISRGGRYSYGPVRTSGWRAGTQHPILRTWKGLNKEKRALDWLVNELRLQHRGNAIREFQTRVFLRFGNSEMRKSVRETFFRRRVYLTNAIPHFRRSSFTRP